MIWMTCSGAPSGTSGSIIFAWCRPCAALGSTQGIGQRADPTDIPCLQTDTQRRPAVSIDLGVLGHRCPFEHLGHVGLDLVEFCLIEDPFEHVEAVPVVRIEDVRRYLAIGLESQRTPVVEGERLAGALFAVGNDGRLVCAVVTDRHIEQGQVVAAHGRPACVRFPCSSRQRVLSSPTPDGRMSWSRRAPSVV